MHEQMVASSNASVQFQVFATDIDDRSLDMARRGRYPDGIANQVSPQRLAHYFERSDSSYQIVKHIRDCCVFSSHDLIRDPPFSRLDLLSCRNLMIYLEPELQKKIVPIFHYALRPGGYLFLGSSDDVAHKGDQFVALYDRKYRIFQRRDTLKRSVPEVPLQITPYQTRGPAELKIKSAHEPGLIRILERIVLDQYTPGCAFIDEKGEIFFLAGETDKFLQRPAGPPSNNIIEIARKSIRLDLRAAIGEAVRNKKSVVRQNISVETSGGIQCVNLIVRPASEAGAGLFLVRFQEVGPPKSATSDDAHQSNEPAVQQLESELKTTREKLETSVGDLEHANESLRSSNEEVLSMNEELQSSNEELQTSKEELQSINEELETVNSELNQKILALTKASNDTKNLFESTQLATVFLDKKLRIGKFTPAARQLFRLIDSDLSRPITDFAPQFVGANLVADAEQVLHSLTPIERQVQSNDRQAYYMMRVLPYRTLVDVIEGVVITFHDVTELRRAQRQRDAIIESSVDAIISKTIDGVITTWNPAARRMYGYSEQEAVGHPISLIIPRDKVEEHHLVLEQIKNGRLIEPFDALRVTKDGRVLDVRISISPIYNDQGLIVGASSISTDITARKSAEKNARRSTGLLRAVVETAADGIITFDENGIIHTANPAAAHIFGYSHSEIVNATITKLVPESYRATLKLSDAKALRNVFRRELEGLRKDGAVFPMDVAISDTKVEGGVIFTAMVRDITQRKLAEQSLRITRVLQESEARFRQLAELIPAIVWTASPDGHVEFVNKRWRDYTATKTDSDYLKSWEEQILHPEDAPAAVAKWSEALKTHQPYDCEQRLRRHDGTYRWHVARALPLFDEQQRVVRWFGTCTDVDDQKHAQETLESADRRKDEFLAILGHELRNPLAPVRTAAHVLQTLVSDNPKLKRACEIIERQSSHMKRIIDDLLDVSRITRGKIILRKEQFDLNDLVRRSAEDNRSDVEASGINLEIKTAAEPLWITADPTRIAQVLVNLLHNARKFTSDGGSISVEVSASADRATAQIAVRDTGIGMTAESINTIFEPFKQGNNVAVQKHGGLGIGLAMVKGLIEMHGGKVSVMSKGAGLGSEFTFHLPLDRKKKAVAKSTPPPAAKPKSYRVLIIEDNVDSAETMRMLFELRGHVVCVAHTAVQGIEMAHEFHPQVAVCDIGLPGEINGYGVAKAFRADKQLKATPLIALTGYGQDTDKHRALESGFDFHLTKPIDPATILELLDAKIK